MSSGNTLGDPEAIYSAFNLKIEGGIQGAPFSLMECVTALEGPARIGLPKTMYINKIFQSKAG